MNSNGPLLAINLRIVLIIAIAHHHPEPVNCTINQSRVVNNLLEKILPVLQAHSDKYIIWFHSMTSVIKHELDDNHPFDNLRLVFLFSFKYKHSSKLRRHWEHRHNQPYAIIIASNHPFGRKNNVFRDLQRYLVHTSSMVFFLTYNGSTLLSATEPAWQNQMNYIPIKIMVNPSFSFSISCNGYCDQDAHSMYSLSGDNVDTIIFEVMENPVKMHKRLYRNANGRQVDAMIYPKVYDYYTVAPYANDRYACSRMVPLRHKDMFYCDAYLVTIMFMAEVHNISFQIYSSVIKEEHGKGYFSHERQLVYGYVSEFDEDEPNYKKPGFLLEGTVEDALFYCKKEDNVHGNGGSFKTGVWTEPFTRYLWISLLVLVFVKAVLIVKLKYSSLGPMSVVNELITVIQTYAGQGVTLHPRAQVMYMVTIIFAWMIGNLYGNSITSLISVKIPPPAFKTVNDLLRSGFRIMFFTASHLSSDITPETFYSAVFKQKRIEMNTSEAFF